jgi:hypothetical protein
MRFCKMHKMVKPYPVYAGYGIVDTRALNIEFGDPTTIIFKKQRTAYVLYSPLATETANSVAQSLYEQGYDVTMVNGASDPEKASKLKRWAIKTYSHLCSIFY